MKNLALYLLFFASFGFAQMNNDWTTVFEKSGYFSTASYDETNKYFQQLADNSDYADYFTFGISPQGRDMKFLLVTKEKYDKDSVNKSSSKIEFKKPIILVINGIHSGEIEGKDACMLLLREILITKEKSNLLDDINLIVIPIFSVDAHERISKYNRINQNGPIEMGWRTTAQNYNLNRDWMKADAPEMQAMLKLCTKILPDFAIDTHTTDGADFRYTLTYQIERFANIDPRLASFLDSRFIPFFENRIEEKGFLIFPYVGFKNWEQKVNISANNWASGPRLSTGYFALQNCPSLLLEMHMLKAYKERVYATKAALESTFEFVKSNGTELKSLRNEADDYAASGIKNKYLPLSFKATDEFEEVIFKGYDYYVEKSDISGGMKTVYTDIPKDIMVKYHKNVISTDSVEFASGYFIPEEYGFLMDRIALHGIKYSVLKEDTVIKVLRYKFKDVKLSNTSNEGRQTVTFDYDKLEENVKVVKGTYYIPTNQRTFKVITALLEPKSSDSFVQWGFMNQIFEQKEYFEDYVMEKIAGEMLKKDPELKKDFENKLAEDKSFRDNPTERLNFFYKRSPYWDNQLDLYPILRLE